MKPIRLLVFLLAASLLGVGSCKQNAPEPDAGEPVVTDPGEPTGAAVSASIGPAGGSLTSADGTVTLQVPAGALDAATTISIQPITNNAPLGVPGGAYRFSPDGQKFKVPVKLTFNYTDQMLGGASPELFWILTQAADGSWKALLSSTVNASARTISGNIKHFSDWVTGRFIDLTLAPAQTWLPPGESVEINVIGFSASSASSANEEDDLAPISKNTNPGEDVLAPIAPSFEKRTQNFKAGQWRLAGEGQLQGNGFGAKYTAPGRIPSRNPVAVSLELEYNFGTTTQKLLLVSNITVIEDDIFSVTVDGVTYKAKQFDSGPGLGIAFCGRGANGALTLGGASGEWGFSLGVAQPRQGAVVLSNCRGGDGATFGLYTAGREYNYLRITRSGSTNNCVSDGGVCPASVTVTFETYSGERTSSVVGKFSGTVYDNNVTGCRSSVPHNVSGYFNLIVAN